MAYAFEKIDDLVNKSNIFGNAPQPSGEEGDRPEIYERAETQPLSPEPQSSRPGSFQGSVRSAPSKQSPDYGSSARSAAISAAQRRGVGVPGSFSRLGESIGEKTKSLGEIAKTYEDNQKKRADEALRVSDTQLEGAVSGQENDYNRIRDILDRPTAPTAEPVPLPSDKQIAKSSELAREALYDPRRAISRGRGSLYTPSQADFDVDALKGSQDYRKLMGTLQSDYNKYWNEAKRIGIESPKAADEYAKKALEESRESIKSGLGTSRSAIEAQQLKESEEAQRYFDNLVRNGMPPEQAADVVSKIRDTARIHGVGEWSESKEYLDQLADYLTGEGTGDNRYLTTDLPTNYKFTPQEFYNPDEVSRYNRIQSLLDEQNKSATEGKFGKKKLEDLAKYDPKKAEEFVTKDVAQDINDERKRTYSERMAEGKMTSDWGIASDIVNELRNSKNQDIKVVATKWLSPAKLEEAGIPLQGIPRLPNGLIAFSDVFPTIFDVKDGGKILKDIIDWQNLRSHGNKDLYIDANLARMGKGRVAGIKDLVTDESKLVKYLQDLAYQFRF